ncbi:MAG TPA: hypothetical protein VKJ65_14310, partial [Phycisphaerae bacterium]|nr:hypothetical protein [Phycisphaerae bacterium]
LTLDVLKFVEGEARHVKITGAMFVGKEQKAEADGKKREPATLAHCINLEDGLECQIIISAVVKSTLMDEYPNDGYVGRCFAITKKSRVAGKQYFPYGIEEIEDPAKPVAMPEPVKPATKRA